MPDTNVQLVIVTLAAAVAALYVGRALWRQVGRPDDEPRGCASCPVNAAGRADPKGRP